MGSQSWEGGSQIKLQLKWYIRTKTLLEYIQLVHSYTVTETSFDSQCCQKIGKKKKKYGDSQIEKK